MFFPSSTVTLSANGGCSWLCSPTRPSQDCLVSAPCRPGMGIGWPAPAPSPFSLPFSPLVLFIAPGRGKPNFHRKQIGWGDRQKDRERWGQRRKTEASRRDPPREDKQGGRNRAEEVGGVGKEAEQGGAVAGFPSRLHRACALGPESGYHLCRVRITTCHPFFQVVPEPRGLTHC